MADDTDTTTIPLTPTSRTAMLDNELPPIEKPSSFSIPWWQQKWKRNQGLFFILLAEMFGAWMVTTARLLQNGTNEKKEGMLTLQIIFIRFALTMLFSTLYMWYTKVPDFPWGKPEVRWMLILRGCAGFFSIFGYYYSVKYLPVAEAVVLSFFNPLLTAYFCYLVLGTSFTTRHLLGGLLCIFGVILIAHPDSLLHLSDPEDPSVPSDPERPAEVPTSKRLLAIVLGVGSCFCSAAVFTLIRLIGFRAHALISVNYYAIIASLTSFLLLLFLPGISFQLPSDVREWLLTFSLGVYGFLLQFLTTKGLQLEKGSRGTNMMYSQIIFALLLDWGIWGVLPSGWSWVGGAVVVGSTVWVAMQDGGGRGEGGKSREGDEEEEGFIRSVGEDEDEDADLERNSDRDDEVAGEEEESR